MPVSLPLGIIFKPVGWLFNWLMKRLLLPTYRRSHALWARRHRLGAYWGSLGEHVEYSVDLARPTDSDPKASRIAFRSRGAKVDQLKLVFEASGGTIRYQEQISVHDLDERPVVWTLVNIPCQELIEASEQRIRFSIETFQIRRCEMQLENGELIQLFDSVTSTLSHNWLLSDEAVYRWNQWWNTNSIKWAKFSIQEYWRFGFGRPEVVICSPTSNQSYREPLWRSGARAIGWVMSRDWVVTVQFWAALWSGLFVLTDDDRLKWRWTTDLPE